MLPNKKRLSPIPSESSGSVYSVDSDNPELRSRESNCTDPITPHTTRTSECNEEGTAVTRKSTGKGTLPEESHAKLTSVKNSKKGTLSLKARLSGLKPLKTSRDNRALTTSDIGEPSQPKLKKIGSFSPDDLAWGTNPRSAPSTLKSPDEDGLGDLSSASTSLGSSSFFRTLRPTPSFLRRTGRKCEEDDLAWPEEPHQWQYKPLTFDRE